MLGATESPGSIRNQVGRSLNSIRESIEEQDVLSVADHLTFLVAISAPKLEGLTDQQRKELEVPEMEGGRDRDGKKARDLFRDCMKILARLLCILSEHGLYAWKEPEIQDASGLRGRDDDDSVSLVVEDVPS